jgi:hypothetical protein
MASASDWESDAMQKAFWRLPPIDDSDAIDSIQESVWRPTSAGG